MSRLVVGGEYYPEAYRRLRVGSAVPSELVAEPWNTYDGNAVAVYVNGTLAGYLASDTAAEYQHLVQRANAAGWRMLTQALVGTIRGERVVRVELPWPMQLRTWLALPPQRRGAAYWPPYELVLGRRELDADALARLVPAPGTSAVLPVVLDPVASSDGVWTQVRVVVAGLSVATVEATSPVGADVTLAAALRYPLSIASATARRFEDGGVQVRVVFA